MGELIEKSTTAAIKELITDNKIDVSKFTDRVSGETLEPKQRLRKQFEDLEAGFTFDQLLIEYETTNPNCDLIHYITPKYDELLKKSKKGALSGLKKEVNHLLKIQESKAANELIVDYCKKWEPIKSIMSDNHREMYIYEDGIYTPNAQSKIKKIVRFCLNNSYNETFVSKAINKIEVDTFISSKEFYKIEDPYKIAIQNGILNLKTGEIEQFSPNKIYFNKINAIYDENAECPNFDKFLSEIFAPDEKEENIKLIYELIGFCLVREYFQEKAFLFQGDGRNGKGKLLNVIKTLLGSDNVAALSLEEIKYDGFNIANLQHKLVNIGGDIGSSKLKSTQCFKSTTGRDTLSANRKSKDFVHFENYAKMIFNANTLPETCDDSEGFYDRWVMVDFPYKFVSPAEFKAATPEQKKNYKRRNPHIINSLTTQEELNGILFKSIQGLKRLIETEEFTGNKSSTQNRELWQIRKKSFEAFANKHIENTVEGEALTIGVSELKEAYESFCLKHRAKKQTINEIDQLMWNLFGSQKEKQTTRKGRNYVYPFVCFKDLEHQKNLKPVGDINGNN